MTAVVVDSNVLLDLMTEDARWFSWSARAVERAADTFRIVINAVIYAEISARYSRIEDLEAALPKAMIEREPIPYEAAFLAGKAFLNYRRRAARNARRFRISSLARMPRSPIIRCSPAIRRDIGPTFRN